MGYRSEVGLACDPIVKEIIETVSEWNSDLRQLMDDADDLTHDKEYGRWRWDWVKWYDSYPEITIMERIMLFAENTSLRGLSYDSYGFVRVGEDYEDIEQRGAPAEFDLYVNRSVEI